MEMNLPNPKAVLANEAFPKGSPRPACIVPPFSSLDELKKLGEGNLQKTAKRMARRASRKA
jgi:hypothetical protein